MELAHSEDVNLGFICTEKQIKQIYDSAKV